MTAGDSLPVFPSARSAQRAGNKRKKVTLKPGHSALDWARLSTSSENLRGIPPQLGLIKVNSQELANHKSPDNAWTVLNGKVYNITRYLDFHPGGRAQLLRVAGKDGSELFFEYHPWVNYHNMLQNCMIGVFIG